MATPTLHHYRNAVMGAGAFMIADYLSVPYGVVVKGAVIPAALFFLSLIFYADIAAARSGLKGLSGEELPDWKKTLAQKGHLLIPVIALVVFIVMGWSAIKTAFWSILFMIALSFLKSETRMNSKKILDALAAGSRDNISIAAACAAAGIIVGVVSATGVGVKFSSLLNVLSASNPILALILTMIAALILGMGLPPTAVYIILAALTIPSLISMGVNPLAAHFFVFFFASIGAITPPVCLAAYSAAAVAKTDPFVTGWKSFRMGLVGYIVPFIFVINPVLLMQQGSGIEIASAFISAAIGVILLTFGMEGFFKKPLHMVVRVLLLISALLLMIPGFRTDVIGIAGLFLAIITDRLMSPKNTDSLGAKVQ
ncbi:TRAP C4-dicarboxylate transport system permease DctM subunit [Moorella glycerini]|uniref:DctM-like transporter n=1 Tax=Neomoorella stamsii TaxID=1266720 RepID=A0A9X7J5L7_9FIRM|nr:TRAP transporter fused permease subunit [Moorella glycerini]PRR77890.1 DctM-like transporter [Moorella stamsii]CEP66132.1 TRAP C4-dicarboxylate transport system permease DctM subunit [Moorella glycerini]